MPIVLFLIFGVVAVACGLAMILSRNPVYGAIYLIGCLIALAGEYVLLNAPFIAALQVLVYAGAIMVLYLFVIMLLNLGHDPGFRWWKNWRTYAALALTGLLGYATMAQHVRDLSRTVSREGMAGYPVHDIARQMFQDPMLVFLIEALGVLLLMAVVGAIYLGRRLRPDEQALINRQAARAAGQLPAHSATPATSARS